MIWALIPVAFILGIAVGGLFDRLAARDARSVRHLRPRQQPALRVVIGGRG
jgi:uncharacterized membrane-anchored protein YhcB (DUF1043 family)